MKFKVVASGVLPGNVVHVFLDPVDRPLAFKPGQFVFIRFIGAESDGIISEAHPFSLASAPYEENGQIRFYMKALGDYTTSLRHLQPGTIAEVEGAFGSFTPAQYSSRPQIWIAGGIGITPFLSAARSFDATRPNISMFYSVQTKGELIDQEVLAEYLPTYYPQFKYFPYVKEEQKDFISAEYINEKCSVLGKDIFLCGPPAMMQSLRKQFKELGVPERFIHSEEFTMQ